MDDKIYGLPPIVDAQARILILGSFPSPFSLKHQEYYAHPRNHFWPIMAGVLSVEIPQTYFGKKAMLVQKGIALWDVIAGCYRRGAGDDEIREPEVNDLNRFLREYNLIRAVFCNGRKAEQLYKMFFGESPLPCCYLPSSSPAHARDWREKVGAWGEMRRYL